MASFDPKTRLDARELDYIINQLDLRQLIRLEQNLYIHEEPFELLERQYNENVDALSGMLFTWHSNQNPANERRLMVNALLRTFLISLAETIEMGDQHHATGNAVASNLNMGMASFDPNTPLDDMELKSVSKQLGPQELLKLSTSSETPVVKLAIRQYKEKADAPSEMLNTWHSNQHLSDLVGIVLSSERLALQPSSEQNPSHPRKRPRPQILQQPDIAPKRIPQQTSFEITEIKLRDVSKELGAEWRMVGTYLGFKNSQIEVMQEQYPVVKECIFQMLLKWRNTNGVEATKTKLKKVLRRSLREDLVDFIDKADELFS